jgi:uncharacterized metal-binding protein YceD (DUF177 family)
MKTLSQYDIDIHGLEEKEYVYEFDLPTAFFEALEQDMIEIGHCQAFVTIIKSSTMFQLKFNISGYVILICDRSLEEFEEPIAIEQQLILKLGSNNEEISDEIEMIRYDTTRINVAKYIFEYIALALPMKRIHPKFRTDEELENDVLVYSTDSNNDDSTSDIDPRWAILKKLQQ